jgi:hypothetical protein
MNPDRELQELTDVEIQDLIARTGIVVSSDFRSIISEHPNFAIDFAGLTSRLLTVWTSQPTEWQML